MELHDIYDRDRVKLGYTRMRGEKRREGEFIVVASVSLFNSCGEMLIQQRQPFKTPWPNLWDITCGGSVVAGETTRIGAEREMLEELGIRVDFSKMNAFVTVVGKDFFADFFVIRREVDLAELVLQEEEVQAVRWATRDEIFAMIDDGSFKQFHKSFIDLLFLAHAQGAEADVLKK